MNLTKMVCKYYLGIKNIKKDSNYEKKHMSRKNLNEMNLMKWNWNELNEYNTNGV